MKSALFYAIGPNKIQDGILRGVSVVTKGEAKGHGLFVDDKSLSTFLSAAQNRNGGVPVKMDHGTGFYHIVGKLENFRIDGDSLRADLHLLKTHEQYARIVEMAETMADSFGLSASFSYDPETIGGKKYPRVDELNSVDLVDRPAANPNGLFVDSSPGGMANDNKAEGFFAGLKQWLGESENKELAELKQGNKDLSEKVSKFEADFKAAAEKATKLEAELKAKTDELAKVPELIKAEGSKEAQRIMASLGQPPVTQTPATNPAEPQKPDTSKMTPRERVIAAFKAQSARTVTNLVTK